MNALLRGEELELVEEVASGDAECTSDLSEREVEVAWRLLAGGFLTVAWREDECGFPHLALTPKALLALPVVHGEFDCYVCGEDAGEGYFSDPRTDQGDFGDVALVLCDECAEEGGDMPDAEALAFYRAGARWKGHAWPSRLVPVLTLAEACLQAGFDAADGAPRMARVEDGSTVVLDVETSHVLPFDASAKDGAS